MKPFSGEKALRRAAPPRAPGTHARGSAATHAPHQHPCASLALSCTAPRAHAPHGEQLHVARVAIRQLDLAPLALRVQLSLALRVRHQQVNQRAAVRHDQPVRAARNRAVKVRRTRRRCTSAWRRAGGRRRRQPCQLAQMREPSHAGGAYAAPLHQRCGGWRGTGTRAAPHLACAAAELWNAWREASGAANACGST
jgi:hypothetical protein